MKVRSIWVAPAILFLAAAAHAGGKSEGGRFGLVKAREFDPQKTSLVHSEWLSGIGCPTGARTAPFLPPDFTEVGRDTYTDPACLTGDRKDKKNEGLLLVKTGPTNDNASAVALLENVRGTKLTELGYDIRKGAAPTGPFGSHCGAGAPRFNVETEDGGFYFVGCSSPPGTPTATSAGWTRLRWGGTVPLLAVNAETLAVDDITGMSIKRITIVFDEGQDAQGGPDSFGAAVLDNIDVNGTLVGRQGAGGGGGGRGHGHGHDQDGDDEDDDDQ
jgi:hypothetical protein